MQGFLELKKISLISLMLILLIGGIIYAQALRAGTPKIAVIYPEIRKPFLSIFQSIISGIEKGLPEPPTTLLLTKDLTLSDLRNKLKQENIGTVITLGNRGLMLGKELSSSHKVVAGAVNIPPGLIDSGTDSTIKGITLTPHPTLMLQHLRRLAPRVQRVTIVYNPKHAGWLIERIQHSALGLGLSINPLPATNLKAAALTYKEVLSGTEKQVDALWLLRDSSILDERAIMPMILAEAWNKQLVIISNNPGHVSKGALFSLYPDNTGLGESLAELAKTTATTQRDNVSLLRNVQSAVNIRTAEHLGIHFNNQDKRSFSLLFPSR